MNESLPLPIYQVKMVSSLSGGGGGGGGAGGRG